MPGGCFTIVSRALQNILSKFVCCRNSTCDENFELKLCACAQSHALGTRTKFQLEIITINVISGVVYFDEIILESSRNVSETTPRVLMSEVCVLFWVRLIWFTCNVKWWWTISMWNMTYHRCEILQYNTNVNYYLLKQVNIQLSAVIVRSNITRYCIHHCSDRGRIWIRDASHLALTGDLWCVFCQNFGENWPHYNGTILYITFDELNHGYPFGYS